MDEIVKIKEGCVVANSLDIYKETKKAHAHVVRDIEKLIATLTLQKRRVRDYFIENTYINSRNREYKTYDMTRDGFVFLAMGYNKEKFMSFKLKFIDAFNAMERELKNIHMSRQIGKETRKVLTDAVRDSGENIRMHGYGFAAYTKLVYKLAGITYKKSDHFRDTLSAAELDRVENIESIIKSLIKSGRQYATIRDDLNRIFQPLLDSARS